MELLFFQSAWGMEGLPGAKGEWSIDQKMQAIADAGFAGVGVEIPPYETAKAITEIAPDLGLKWTMECFPKTVDDLGPIIDAVIEFGPEQCDHINLQPDLRPHTVLECIPYVLGWQQMADDAGMTLYIETHRDRMTTDLMFTLQLIDAMPPMRLTADLSHYLVGREFSWPVTDKDHDLIRRILERSWAFHGRVASREQVQVPIGFPQHQRWLQLFLDWWEEGLSSCRSRADAHDHVIFTTELGPPPYAITGADGEELSDRWEEALEIKRMVGDRWDRLEESAT